MMSPRIAITGFGAISALGCGAEQSFKRLVAGEVGVEEQAVQPASSFFGLGAGLVGSAPGFSPDGVLSPALPSRSTPEQRSLELSRTEALSVAAIREAMASAGLSASELSEAACGLVWGTTTGGLREAEVALAELAAGDGPCAERSSLLAFPISGAMLRAAEYFGCFAHQRTVCSACSSGAVAIALGAMWIQSGVCQRVVVGGADALCATTQLGFGALGLLDLTGCKPFDPRREGLCLGEGAAALMLEAEAGAVARRAKVHAWLDGWAVGAEAFHITQPEPRGETQVRLIRRAMARAGVSPRQVDYVAAHGTGTPRNDATELLALNDVFGADFARPRVSSNKAQLGHTLGAAGALSAVFSVLALTHGCLPPNPESRQATHPALIGLRAEASPARIALVNAFGFGGMDAVLCLAHAERSSLDVGSRAAASGKAATYVLRSAVLAAAAGEDPRRVPGRTQLLAADRSRRFDDLSLLVTASAERCLADLELAADDEVALLHGSAFGLIERAGAWLQPAAERGSRRVAPAEFPLLLPSAASGNASVYLGLRGLVAAVSRLGASAHAALHTAFDLVSAGEAAMALSCAAEPLDRLAVEVGTGWFGMQAPVGWCAAAQLIAPAPRPAAGVCCRVETWGETAGAVPPPPAERARGFLGSDDGSVEIAPGAWGALERSCDAHPSVDGLGGRGVAACFDAIERGEVDAALLVDVVAGRLLYSVFVREVLG